MKLDWKARGTALGALALTVGLAATLAPVAGSAAKGTDYALAHSYALGGDGGWDYLTYDTANKHLFISRATRVMVVDPASGSPVGEIANTPGVHGIALAPDLNKGFTSNGRGNSVTVFDLKTLATSAIIPISGKNPDAIMYDPASKHIFTFNGGSNDATVIDAATNSVIATIPLPGKPEFAASNEAGMVYVNIEDKSEILAIDATANSVAKTWPLAPCDGPSGLALDVQHHRLFAGCGNKIMSVVNADTGAVVASLPIGDGVDATAFDPKTQLAFSSNGDGTLTVIHEDSPDTFSVVGNAATQQYARTMALDSATHAVYLVTAKIKMGPPAAGQQRPTRTVLPGSFTLLVMSQP